MLDNDMIVMLGLAGAVMVTVVLLGMTVIEAVDGEARRRQKRTEKLRSRHAGGRTAGDASYASLKRNQSYSAIPTLDVLLRRYLPNPEKLHERLMQTGTKVTAGTYVLLSLFLGGAAGVGVKVGMTLPAYVPVLVGIFCGLMIPHVWVNFMIGSRQKAFLEQFPEAIDLIVRGLRSGLPVTESIAAVGNEMPDPVGIEFRRVSEAIRLGQSIEAALWAAVKRIGLPEIKFFVVTISIQRETGGNLAETLENLSDILRRRRQMKLKVRAMSSEAKASAMIIGCLPFVMAGLIYAVNPDYVMLLIEDPRGNLMMVVGLMSMALGIGVMIKMVRFEI
jgi:tight adherence protein B